MAKGEFLLIICALMVISRVQACYIPPNLDLNVHNKLPKGSTVTTVEVADCDIKSLKLSCTHPDFTIEKNGDLVTKTTVYVSSRGETFSVIAQDSTGSQSVMEVSLHQEIQHNSNLLRRSKRRWAPPPFNVRENDLGPFPKEIDKIVSDASAKYSVYYTLSGPGYNEAPVGLFNFDRKTGMFSINKPMDREQYARFELLVNVYEETTNTMVDKPLPIKIEVDDVNDNHPQFSGSLQFSVPEQSSKYTVVGQVNSTDRDDPKSAHVRVRYSLLTGTDLFSIDPVSGVITTVSTALDRETKDKHMVTVQLKDNEGASNGLVTTGTATITLSDINDNPPTFKQPSFTATVQENEMEKLVLRIPVDDKDLINTDNWFSKFVLTKGNENGNFRVDSDPKTNEGLLYVIKPLDFEKTPSVKLEVMAQNKASLKGTSAQWLTVPIDLTVTNVDEGPEFIPSIKYLTVKENTPNGTVIGTYIALDPETKTSLGFKYYKVTDPASWITVERGTGELKVANTIDRESSYVKDGIYNITVRAVDTSSKTGTGTVVITVEDVNDNIPKLPSEELVLCEKEGDLGSVVLVAEDKDQPPFAEPFTFSSPSDSQDDSKWTVTKLNDSAATLQQLTELHTGVHDINVLVTDLQGSGTLQTVRVRICRCVNGVCPAQKSSITMGPMGWLALLLPLLLLLLLLLLLGFLCLTSHQKLQMDDAAESGGVLLKSNTEALGEEVDSSLLVGPSVTVDSGGMGGMGGMGSIKGSVVNAGWIGNKSTSSMQENGMYKGNIVTSDTQYTSNYAEQQFGMYGEGQLLGNGFDNRFTSQDISLLHTWQTNGRYLDQKLYFMGEEDEGRYADDVVHSYGFEGVGSVAGSVGCCSDFGEESLDFLDRLGPKFKTLAEVCSKR
ncbi:desmocollin 2-like protein [Eucyclogobius newberryi]|uniref:desmocollin 2-like protein n=1 Tax=Eucyclogobius newberryi TaxID=166745 RepID=UPI003B59A588